jgi:hypothetical protein
MLALRKWFSRSTCPVELTSDPVERVNRGRRSSTQPTRKETEGLDAAALWGHNNWWCGRMKCERAFIPTQWVHIGEKGWSS